MAHPWSSRCREFVDLLIQARDFRRRKDILESDELEKFVNKEEECRERKAIVAKSLTKEVKL